MQAGFYDSKGKLQRLSFTQAFLGSYLNQRTLRPPRKTVKVKTFRDIGVLNSSHALHFDSLTPPSHSEMGACLTREKIVEVQKPASITTAAPPADPPAPPAAPAASAGTPQPEATPVVIEEAKPVETPLTWTALEDATLIGLKALNKTWKEIGAVMKDKPTEDLRERYDELNIKTVKANEADTKKEEPKPEEAKSNEGGDNSSDHGGNKKGKSKKGKEKKGDNMSDESKEKKAKAMKAKEDGAQEELVEAETTDSTKNKPLKGILKKGKGSQKMDPGDHQSTHYQGRPIIYADGGEPLNIAEVGSIASFSIHLEITNSRHNSS